MKQIAIWLAPLALLGTGCASDQPVRRSPSRAETPNTHAAKPAPEPTPASQPAAYRPGIRINWARREVEVDAEVILREGALELLACSPNTKEHESILRVDARPLHIYEAMGLVGLTPGKPVAWDKKNQRTVPASGDAVALRVRYHENDQEKTVFAHEWLRDAESGRPMKATSWVFAGSQRLEDGAFYADLDGTVVTVVDFSSALIGVPSSHSADNAALWLEPHTARIPPLNTKCVLLIRSAEAD